MFVFAVTRVTTLLNGDLSWAGFGRAMIALALVWWAWSAFAWAANAQDPDATFFRVSLLIATALILVVGIALPRAFAGQGTLFAVAYAGVRLLHLAVYADAARRGNAELSSIAGFAVTVAIGMALLVVGSFLHALARDLLWVAAAAIDYAGPAGLTRERLRGLQQVAVAHFAERYGLFVIICIGESIAAIGTGAGARGVSTGSVTAMVLALLITIALWWIYFARAEEAEEALRTHEDQVIAAADSYSYLHLALVAGIIIFAVGARHTVANYGDALSTAARLALCGGVALYLAGHVAFRARLTGTVDYPQLLAAAGAIVLFGVSGAWAAWVTAAALTAGLALLVGWQLRAEPEDRSDP